MDDFDFDFSDSPTTSKWKVGSDVITVVGVIPDLLTPLVSEWDDEVYFKTVAENWDDGRYSDTDM